MGNIPPVRPPPPPPPGNWFEVEFTQARLLHKALTVLFSADVPLAWTQLPLAGDIQDAYADFHTLRDPGRVLVVVRGLRAGPIVVDTCLAITLSDLDRVLVERAVRLSLSQLEVATDRAVSEARTLCLKGATPPTEIVCSLKHEDAAARRVPVQISVIPVNVTYTGDWSIFLDNCRLSLRVPVSVLNIINEWNRSPVSIRVTQRRVKFEAGDKSHTLITKTNRVDGIDESLYTIMNRTGNFPYDLRFNFHLRDTISKAMALSDHVIFHLTSDSRCCLEIPLQGLGCIYFRFLS